MQGDNLIDSYKAGVFSPFAVDINGIFFKECVENLVRSLKNTKEDYLVS